MKLVKVTGAQGKQKTEIKSKRSFAGLCTHRHEMSIGRASVGSQSLRNALRKVRKAFSAFCCYDKAVSGGSFPLTSLAAFSCLSASRFLPPGVSGGGNSPQVIAVRFQLYIPAPHSCVAFCLKAGARKEWEQPRMYGEDL